MSKERYFISSILIQIITIVISYIFLSEYIIRKYVLPNDLTLKSVRIFKSSNSPNVIWGDSQTLEGINNMDNFVNLSMPADTFQDIEVKIKKYYSNIKNKKNKKAIFLLGINAFGDVNDKPQKSILREILLNDNKEPFFYFSKSYFRKRSSSYIRKFIINGFKFSPSEAYKFNDDGSLSVYSYYKTIEQENFKAFENNYLGKSNVSFDLLTDFFEDGYVDSYLNSPNYYSLLNIIRYLKKENINTCYITTPRHKDIRKPMMNIKSYSLINSFYKKLSLDEGLYYLDFSELDYPASFYSDPKHLNYKGAKEFTKKVNKSCSFHFNNMKLNN